MTKMKKQILLFAAAFLFLLSGSIPAIAQKRKVSQIERRADRNFIKQKFDKAMAQYETAVTREANDRNKASIHLKTARLYFMLRNYANASAHYGKALALHHDLFSVDDLCSYVDALRFHGENKKAEAICLDNAYKDIYSRYQRYQNMLDALAMRHSIIENPESVAKKLSLNTPKSEFWVGYYDGNPFYAMSVSNFNDPGKLFFHRTHYYPLDETGEEGAKPQKSPRYNDYFRHIPIDLQNGPVSFSPDMRMMVATMLEYQRTKASVDVASKSERPFRTKLLYSTLSSKGNRFSKYKILFNQEPGYSYAHPYLFNDGKSLLFVSDKPGGHGGFDLYMTHFDEETQTWDAPINLGPRVNTEGDEICPVLFEDRLIFSSNGLPGFGGYDLFSTFFEKDGSRLPENATHFPYPVNSVFNDYFMHPLDLQTAYFVSDRDLSTRDDIYYLRALKEWGSDEGKPYYGMSEEAAVMGGHLLLSGLTETAVPESVELGEHTPKGLLLTVYFDFNSSALTPESVRRLMGFINETDASQLKELTFSGYADEVGGDNYNYALSERRARAVADFLRNNGVSSSFTVIGHGSLKLSPEEVDEEVSGFPWSEGKIDWTRINRRARRVEIYNNK
ncbi:MAG: OmpA family protein [Mediterranea sp.]|jgi:outer membrane protein OmpA-like peptidoglycan-associated protein|nr:OmpA family protein [Mediterranea sp.]